MMDQVSVNMIKNNNKIVLSLVLMVIVFLLLVGCQQKPEPVPNYIQENFSDVSEDSPINKLNPEISSYRKTSELSYRCEIGDLNYYLSSYFTYHINNKDDQIIYSPVGEYLKPNKYPNWQLKMFIDKNNSLYNKTLNYMQDKKLPNGENISCEMVSEIPVGFDNFIITHASLFNKKYTKPSLS